MEGYTRTIVWVHGGGCDGCSMSVLGATSPRLEELLAGALSRSRIELVHPYLTLDAGSAYTDRLEAARAGALDPFVLIVEGAMFDQSLAGEGSFSRLGRRAGVAVPPEDWVTDLARAAEVVVAIGTCATWGGVPAAAGSITGATGVPALLGEDYRSNAGLPVINVPGCAVSGDAVLEALQYLMLHLDGVVPFDHDSLGRPAWLYADETPLRRARAGHGDRRSGEALTAPCPVPRRGWINRLGGCAAVGGECVGCTRPDFPDRTLPLVVG